MDLKYFVQDVYRHRFELYSVIVDQHSRVSARFDWRAPRRENIQSASKAVTTLAGYGILPSDSPDTELTRENLALYTACLFDTSDYDAETMSLDAYPDAADVTAGLEQYVGWIFGYEVMIPTEEGLIAPQQIATRGELAYTLYVIFAE